MSQEQDRNGNERSATVHTERERLVDPRGGLLTVKADGGQAGSSEKGGRGGRGGAGTGIPNGRTGSNGLDGRSGFDGPAAREAGSP